MALGGGALQVILIIIAVILMGGIGAFGAWYFNKKKLQEQYIVYIFNKYGSLTQDFGGVYKDWKTKTRLFFLKKNKVGLNPDVIPYMQMGKKKVVFLFQTGLNRFHYMKLKPQADGLKYKVGQEDTNWAKLEFEKSKKTFQSSLLMQILPYLAVGITAMIIMIMVIYVLKRFDVLKDVAITLKETAQILQQTNSGVIPS